MRVLFLAGVLCLLSGAVNAKYVRDPEGVKTPADWNAQYMFVQMDKDKDGFLSREEYLGMNQTRDVKRQNRQDQKDGVSRSLFEEFDMMDADGEGFISMSDLSYLLTHKNRERQEGKKLPYPVTSRIEETEDGNEQKVIEVKQNRLGYYHPESKVIMLPKEEELEKKGLEHEEN